MQRGINGLLARPAFRYAVNGHIGQALGISGDGGPLLQGAVAVGEIQKKIGAVVRSVGHDVAVDSDAL